MSYFYIEDDKNDHYQKTGDKPLKSRLAEVKRVSLQFII